MDFGSLPDRILNGIAEYVSLQDLMSLSQTSRALVHLQPAYQYIRKKDFHVKGPDKGSYQPETFFDVPISARGLLSVQMRFRWKDQGYGNRKGHLWLELLRDGVVIADNLEEHGGLAPHEWEDRDVLVSNHDVVRRYQPGDILRVVRNVGGGGGHILKVRKFRMRLAFQPGGGSGGREKRARKTIHDNDNITKCIVL